MEYRRRIMDETLDELFPVLVAAALEGARGVGKTATASRRAKTVISFADSGVRSVFSGNSSIVTDLPLPIFIDGWQLVPQVWEQVRKAVDDGAVGGSYLLAGSAGIQPGSNIHSGAGRIVRLTMRPMSFAERDVHDSTVSLRELTKGIATSISGKSSFDLPAYVDEILRSGFPGIRDLPERARRIQLDSYISRLLDREMAENGINVRRPAALRSWLTAYAAATATTAGYGSILDAATPGEGNKPARQTVSVYREELTRMFLLDPLEAWTPAFSTLKRLSFSPKHHLVDPALAARLVGIDRLGLLSGRGKQVSNTTGSFLGALFESLVTQSVRVYADAFSARVYHLRTRDNIHEIDLIVENDDLSCIAIEVKLSDSVDRVDTKHLSWLKELIGDRLVDRIIINTGKFAYRRPDGVSVVPFALLGP